MVIHGFSLPEAPLGAKCCAAPKGALILCSIDNYKHFAPNGAEIQ